MIFAERFQIALSETAGAASDIAELLPVWLAQACVQALPVAGAAISVMDGLRVPIGASDHNAAIAERLQTTLGEGPCLAAHQTRRPVVATEGSIRDTWPAFYSEFVARTPYRAAASVPLSIGIDGFGELDFYFRASADVAALSLSDACLAAEQISAALNEAPWVATPFGVLGPSWLSGTAAQDRLQAWQAIGRINAALDLDAEDALSLLRANAYATGRDLDDVAADVVSGYLSTASLRL